MAIYLMGDSSNRVDSLELHRRLGLTYESASFPMKNPGGGVRPTGLGKKVEALLETE